MNPFEYVNAICDTKQNLIVDEVSEKNYNPFMVNRSLSYHYDTVLLANEMNQRHFLDKKLQNEFLINTIRKKKGLPSGLNLSLLMIWKWLKSIMATAMRRLVKFCLCLAMIKWDN